MPRVCDKCQKEKALKNFLQLSCNPTVRATTCMACTAEEQAKDLQAEVGERATKREVVRAKRAIKKHKALQRAYYERTVEKQKAELSEAKRELARRELAKRRLIQYILRFQPNYSAGWVHYDICRRLERFMRDVEDGLSPRLMLFMPPRHGKSLIASDYFPSWVLGHHPDYEIIASSYAVSLPLGFSRKVRGRIKDPAYSAMFPNTVLDPESKAAEGWNTTIGGGYVAAGVGGGITGKGAHVLIIDDPIKDATEADSETIRETIWDWYGSTAYTRLAPGGGVLVIQTRWHDDDLSGRLITQMKTLREEGVPEEEIDNWQIVSYPAEAVSDEFIGSDGRIIDYAATGSRLVRHKGESLHDARFPIARLRRIKRSLQPRHWSALYQQNPVPNEGEFFTKDMFRMLVNPPPHTGLRLFMTWDLAAGLRQVNDYSVGAVGGLDYNDQLHVVDIIRGRWDTFAVVEAILDMYEKYRPEVIGIELGQLELSIRPQLNKRMRERKLYPTFDETLRPITDKISRARPLQGRMQQGMVYFPATASWIEMTRHEMLRFPGGVHDDIVDSLAWLARVAMKSEPPKPPKAKRLKSWKDKLKGHVAGTGKSPMAA